MAHGRLLVKDVLLQVRCSGLEEPEFLLVWMGITIIYKAVTNMIFLARFCARNRNWQQGDPYGDVTSLLPVYIAWFFKYRLTESTAVNQLNRIQVLLETMVGMTYTLFL